MNTSWLARGAAGLLLGLATGCGSKVYQPARANVRYLVFEAEPALIDRVVAGRIRSPLEASEYSLTILPADGMVSLSKAMTTGPGTLVDATRLAEEWPGAEDAWSYAQPDGPLAGSGGGRGSLGVATKDGVLILRFEYDVTHGLGMPKPFASRLRYEGEARERDWLVFHAPFARRDGTPRVHVIAFRVTPAPAP